MDEPFHSFTVGNFLCTIISDGSFAYPHPAHTFFSNAVPNELADALRSHQIDAQQWQSYVSPYSGLLIDTGRNRVLVDSGAGSFGPDTGKLMQNLSLAGIAPETIDTVILTHGHADHVGGNLDGEGKPAFPNARFVMWQTEWDFWLSNPDLEELALPLELKQLLCDIARANLLPLQDQIDLIANEAEIVPGVSAISAPGHTPGHIALLITSEGEQLLYLVDALLHPIHVEHPEWYSSVDIAPTQVLTTRRRLLKRAADEKSLVMVFHFPFPGLGHILSNGEGWLWQPLSTTESDQKR